MKKYLLSIFLLSFFINTNAIKNKFLNDSNFYTNKGNFSIQMNAKPFVNFLLNVVKIGSNTNDNFESGFVEGMDNVFVGKYFFKNNSAIRAKFGLNYFNNKDNTVLGVYGDNSENEYLLTSTNKSSNILLGIGAEKHLTNKRLRAFYGGEFLIGFGSPTIESKDYNLDLIAAINENLEPINGSRSLGTTKSNYMKIGVRSFLGFEFFIFNRLSIGTEFGFGIYFDKYKQIETTEKASGNNIVSIDNTKFNGSTFASLIDMGIGSNLRNSGAINLSFYF